MENQKRIFLYALILTFFVFNSGVFMGYMLEKSRVNKINDMFSESDLLLLDQRVQSMALEVIDLDCEALIEENINFADKIFEEAMIIQRYEDANRINEDVVLLHKRYDLLRTLFWVNSVKIKERCNAGYHNIAYLYRFDSPTVEQGSKQRFFSKLLLELKGKYGNEIMLIPIAADNDLSSINLLLEKYEIEELPVILIDESIKVTKVESIEDIEQYLN